MRRLSQHASSLSLSLFSFQEESAVGGVLFINCRP